MPSIGLRDVRNFALRGVTLDVGDGELLTVMGPNGAGKTTLMNVVAGLVDYEGAVLFDGAPVDDVPPGQRSVGYVPQGLALFTHMTVWDNVAFGLRMRGLDRCEIEGRVEEVLRLLEISHLRDRHPARLSGGERQRVAIARALAPEPSVLLLDEPFNDLDSSTRRAMRLEVRRLVSEVGVTTLFVTHDWVEAEELGGRVAVLIGGRVLQVGGPEEVIFNPAAREVSEFLGLQNLLECDDFREVSEGLAEVRCGGLKILVPFEGGRVLKVAIPPERVVLARRVGGRGWFNTFRGVVRSVRARGSLVEVDVRVGGVTLTARAPAGSEELSSVREGEELFVKLPIRHIRTLTGDRP